MACLNLRLSKRILRPDPKTVAAATVMRGAKSAAEPGITALFRRFPQIRGGPNASRFAKTRFIPIDSSSPKKNLALTLPLC
jgi:hypothetical protein